MGDQGAWKVLVGGWGTRSLMKAGKAEMSNHRAEGGEGVRADKKHRLNGRLFSSCPAKMFLEGHGENAGRVKV